MSFYASKRTKLIPLETSSTNLAKREIASGPTIDFFLFETKQKIGNIGGFLEIIGKYRIFLKNRKI